MTATPNTLDLVGTSDVAALAGVARRTVEWWVDRGWLVPAAVAGKRNVWTRSYIEAWLQHPRPPARRAAPDWKPAPPPEPLDLIGLDGIAADLGVSMAAARWKLSTGALPPPAARVSGALVWRRADLP